MDYREELYQTPEILSQVLSQSPIPALCQAPHLVFCGCGTSFYLCAQLANLYAIQKKNAQAAEAIDLLERPSLSFPSGTLFVFLSRSGSSMETVLAQKRAASAGFSTFYLGCTEGSPLARLCQGRQVLPYACEQLILESYSSTAQLLCLALACGLSVSPDVPSLTRRAITLAQSVYERCVKGLPLRRLICLGGCFYAPLLRELMLKNGELTLLPSEAWGLLEFRHGPRSWADESCLITAIPGRRTFDFERRAAQELISYGCPLLWCGSEPPEGSIPISLGAAPYSVEETLCLLAFQISLAAQLGADLGVDAASPRHVLHSVEEL